MEEKCLVMWLNITLNEEFFTLDSHTVKCLTLVSRYIANGLKKYIQQNYWFDLSSESGRRLTHYSPTNQTQVMNINEITPSTKKVVFCYNFDKQVDTLLSPHLTHIQFGRFFSQPVHSLPHNLTHLGFVGYFNGPLLSLPPNVQQVTFGEVYNHPVDHLSKQIQFQRRVYNYHKHTYVTTPYQHKPK